MLELKHVIVLNTHEIRWEYVIVSCLNEEYQHKQTSKH